MANGTITARVENLRAAAAEMAVVDASYVLRRLVEIDQMDVLDVLTDEGHLKPIQQWPKVWRQYLSGMDVAEMKGPAGLVTVLKKIKWPDKLKNLELLGKHLQVGAFVERVDHTSSDKSMSPANLVIDKDAVSQLVKLLEG